MQKRAIITGISGQDGWYLSEHLLELGYEVIGVTRRASREHDHLTPMIDKGLVVIEGDITDSYSMLEIVDNYKPDHIYGLAAMSQVQTSFQSPCATFDITGKSVINILEAIRRASPNSRFYQASSSEIFGKSVSKRLKSNDEYEYYQDLETVPAPQSVYAICKLAGHHAVRLYREAYGIFACSGVLFNHESPHRSTRFVTRKITEYVGRLSLAKKYNLKIDRLQLGNIHSFRDWSSSYDMVRAMVLMLNQFSPKDYVIGSGETHSVKEFAELAFSYINEEYDRWININPLYVRPAEVDYLRADPSVAKKELGWQPKYSFQDLVKEMVESDIKLAERNFNASSKD